MSLLKQIIKWIYLFVNWDRSASKTLNKEHGFSKKWLNNLAFSLKYMMNLLWWKRGVIQRIFCYWPISFRTSEKIGKPSWQFSAVFSFRFFDGYVQYWFCKALIFSKRNVFLLEQQCNLNAKFFSIINFLISYLSKVV